MTKREVVRNVLEGKKPPYVPWSFSFTIEARDKIAEVMDVASLMPRYRGRLTFHGGLSTQRTLPYGTPEDVRRETRNLIALGRDGGYILSPAHAVEGDVPLENMLAFIDEAKSQPGFAG